MLKREKHMKKLWKKWFTKTYSQDNKFELLVINDEVAGIYHEKSL